MYNCASGIKVTISEFTEKVINILGVNNPIINYGDWTPGDIKVFDINNTKIKDSLGITFMTDFDNGLEKTINWAKKYFSHKINLQRLMYKDFKIAVVVPAYNEQLLIIETLKSIPDYVDKIYVINDCSSDNTLELLNTFSTKNNKVEIINHEVNLGLGQSLIDGYVKSKNSDIDITAIMAGDNQMDPDDLPSLLDCLITRNFDYAKGNRLLHQQVGSMPKYRFIGNSILTILTKFATGYYFSMDPQCGYTAIKNAALKKIPI